MLLNYMLCERCLYLLLKVRFVPWSKGGVMGGNNVSSTKENVRGQVLMDWRSELILHRMPIESHSFRR